MHHLSHAHCGFGKDQHVDVVFSAELRNGTSNVAPPTFQNIKTAMTFATIASPTLHHLASQ
jgi:hypothetical protein